VIACLTGLTPSKTATYAVSGDGDRREGVVRAQPRWSRPADAQNIAIGSCFFLASANPIALESYDQKGTLLWRRETRARDLRHTK
jgi:hypothetical protein